MPSMSCPERASNEAVKEFKFHISPVWSSSRLQVAVGNCGTRNGAIPDPLVPRPRCQFGVTELVKPRLASARRQASALCHLRYLARRRSRAWSWVEREPGERHPDRPGGNEDHDHRRLEGLSIKGRGSSHGQDADCEQRDEDKEWNGGAGASWLPPLCATA